MIKKFILVLASLMVSSACYSQVSLDECQNLARENYPAIKRYGLIEQAQHYRLSEIAKGWIPQASLSAKATYQSDVTGISLSIPGIDIPALPKLQYQGTVDVSQNLWDGGAMKALKSEARASSNVEVATLEVELYQLRESVNNLYFGILLAREQLDLNEIYICNLKTNLAKMESKAINGAVSVSDVDAVKVGIVEARQQRIDIEYSLETSARTLELMIGKPINIKTNGLVEPKLIVVDTAVVERPELDLFDAQGALVDSKLLGLNASTMPRFNAFVQGGVGMPGLNMFGGGFSNWAMGGLRLSWNFSAFYGKSDMKKQIAVNRQNIENSKEVFLYNLNLQKNKQQKAIENYTTMMSADDEIIALRESVEKASTVKMEQGVIGASDFMREALATQQARQNKSLRRMQMLMEVYKLKTTLNN